MKYFPLCAAASLAAVATAQHDHAAWLHARYQDLQKTSIQTVLADAAREGIPQGERLALKRAFTSLRGKQRHGRPIWQRVDFPPVPVAPGAIGVDAGVEVENNDGWQWADNGLGQTSLLGDCTATDDVDDWQILSVGGFYTFTVTATGSNPITDSILSVRNDRGDLLAFNDDAVGFLSQISMYLPVGLYVLEISSFDGTGGGTYDLQIGNDPVNLVPLTTAGGSGTTRAPLGGLPHDVFTFTVPEGTVALNVVSGQDTFLVIQRADGLLFFANDDGASGTDAVADVDLPAGSYTAYVSEINGTAGVAFTLPFAQTPGTFPNVCTTPSVNGNVLGAESLRMYRAVLPAAQRLTMTTSNGPGTPSGETIVALYDPTLDFLCDVDDDDPSNPARGFYSRMEVDLPAATYFVGVTSYPAVGGSYTMNSTCTAYAPTGTATFGTSPTTIAGFGRINTYLLDNCTTTTTFFGADDYYYALIDRNGELASCSYGDPIYPQGGEVPAGTNTVLVWDRYDYTGPLTLEFRPAFAVENGSAVTRGKAGDITFLFAQVGMPTPGLNLGLGDRGLFCLPLGGPIVSVGFRIVPPSGVSTWFPVPPGVFGIVMQPGDVHTGIGWMPAAFGTWRNVLTF